ncbi:MAG: hypothetical protein JRH20_11295 [Deltaproteobacteria bacterium]|nr:hypothetical protein [Deltaproteobacteria bacterium]
MLVLLGALMVGCTRIGFKLTPDARVDASSEVDGATLDSAQTIDARVDLGALDAVEGGAPDMAREGLLDDTTPLPDLATGTNLLVNASCESPASVGIAGWTAVTCPEDWVCAKPGQINQPQDGEYLFFPQQCSPAHLEQIVDVRTWAAAIDQQTQRFRFSGWFSNWQNTGDSTQILVQYLTTPTSAPLGEYDSGVFNLALWQELTDERLAPMGTQFIRVELVARRSDGSDNDGYFDNLRLEALP